MSNRYMPEYERLNKQPILVNTARLSQNDIKELTMNKQKSINNSLQTPKIKPAKNMQNPEESMWYDEPQNPPNGIELNDNNENVDIDQIQKFDVINKTNNEQPQSEIDSIRQKFSAQEPKKERIAKPGEFVVLLKKELVFIGNLEDTKEVCKQIIVETDVQDNDLIVFLRVPLKKLF